MTTELTKIDTLAPIWIIAFTGHRPDDTVKGRSQQEISGCRASLRKVLDSLNTKADSAGGKVELLCSLAEGSDLLAISVAKELGIPVHLILPMPLESFAEDFNRVEGDSGSPWSIVEQYHKLAHDPSSEWTIRIANGDNVRPGCYHETNLQMIESADVLVSICKGDLVDEAEKDAEESKLSVGGAAEMIRMASTRHFDIPTIIIDPAKDGEIIREDDWDLEDESLQLLVQINGDLSHKDAKESKPNYQRDGVDAIWTIHKALDNVANNNGDKFRHSFSRSIWLHFWATVLAAITAAYLSQFKHDFTYVPVILTTVELLLVLSATILVLRAQKTFTNSTWRRARFGAELVDSQIHSAGFVDPLRPISMRHGTNWKRFAVVVGLVAHRQEAARVDASNHSNAFSERKKNYLQMRVSEQSSYLKSKQKKASLWFHRWSRVAKVASVIALFVISYALFYKAQHEFGLHEIHVESALVHVDGHSSDQADLPQHPEDSHKAQGSEMGWWSLTFVLFLPILLPLLAGLSSSLIVAGDAARRASRYQQVRRRLQQFEKIIPAIQTESAMQRVVTEVEDILLDEMIEWHATAENMEHMH